VSITAKENNFENFEHYGKRNYVLKFMSLEICHLLFILMLTLALTDYFLLENALRFETEVAQS